MKAGLPSAAHLEDWYADGDGVEEGAQDEEDVEAEGAQEHLGEGAAGGRGVVCVCGGGGGTVWVRRERMARTGAPY